MNFELFNADCLDVLKELPDNSIDSIVTDPPAGISFMGKSWDDNKGGRDEWIKWLSSVMKECLRILKPGAHGLVWAIPRTSHWTATACEDAGFEIRDVVTHIFGSGFPKSLDISKAIDKAAGAERKILGRDPNQEGRKKNKGVVAGTEGAYANETEERVAYITAPTTPEAKQWQGWGTALKPASEHWILVRKPLSEKTVARNVLKHGTGGMNIGAGRIGSSDDRAARYNGKPAGGNAAKFSKDTQLEVWSAPSGRFPANLVLSHNEDCVEVGVKKVGNGNRKDPNERVRQGFRHGTQGESLISGSSNAPDNYGTETVAAWQCGDGCAVAMLDEQSRVSKSTGGASRFFYVAKASKSDKGADNIHPTVKSTKLMSYLIKLITPPGGVVLDPFAGSGSTGLSALKEGFIFIGIEKEKEYFEIAQKRLIQADK